MYVDSYVHKPSRGRPLMYGAVAAAEMPVG